jgi:[acyl-carrier-protein] S-malonyltransferase
LTAGSTAFLFPGQGSQTIGMGRACAESYACSREVFEAADEALGFELGRLCAEGPEEELQLTANTQPAILTASIAVYRALESEGAQPDVVAGHSLGEYTALVAAGALEFVDAVRLVRRRGELMQDAVPAGVGAMAALLGLEEEVVREVALGASEGDSLCAVANLNAPGQTVVAGHRDAVERAVAAASSRGAKRAVLLAVSAPFHSPLMAPARMGMAPLLAATPFTEARVPVVCNVDAAPLRDGERIRDALLRQIDSPVRWVESIRHMTEALGVKRFVEVGPGRVLTGLVRRIVADAGRSNVADPAGIGAFVES